MPRIEAALVVLSLLMAGCHVAGAELATIQLDLGDYASADAASAAEAEIDWADADRVDDARCTLAFAALELQEHLQRLFAEAEGAQGLFPIRDLTAEAAAARIVLACPELRPPPDVLERVGLAGGSLAELGPQAFRLKSAGDVLLIYGGGRRGALYGVYELLERLGVRWFGPEPHDTHIPRLRWQGLPELDLRDEPAFVTRGFWAWEDRGNPGFFDWMARNRLNFWTAAEDNAPALKKRGLMLTCGGHLHQSRFLNPRDPYPYDYSDFAGDDGPADPYPHGDYRGDVNEDGVLSYSEAHPEWYGLRDGERSFNIHGDGGDNYCTSNPHATAELMKNIVHALSVGQWRNADSINFWMLDGGRWCQCEKCKALGTPTDRNLLLVHRLRQEIEQAQEDGRLHRNVRIFFLAYADVVAPPTRPLPEGFDYENCIATFFPIGRCYVHTLDDPACTEYNSRYEKLLHGWATEQQRHYRGQICVGEYYNISGFKCLPINFFQTMPHDVRHYHERGARHMHYMHCITRKLGTRALTNWLFARLLWDPEQDEEALLADYLQGRYGPVAGEMREVHADLHTALSNATELKYRLSRRISGGAEDLFSNRHMSYEPSQPETNDGPDFLEMLQAAEAASSRVRSALETEDLPPPVEQRLREDLQPIEYARALLHFYDEVITTMWLQRDGQQERARERFAEAAVWQDALEAVVEPVAHSSSHASAANGFQASYISQAWHRLMLEYGEALIEPVVFDAGGGAVAVTGDRFSGGGALRYGNTLNVGGGSLSTHANFVYAASQSPYDRMKLVVQVTEEPAADLEMVITGTIAPRGDEPVPIAIAWNEESLFEGPAPFEAVKLSQHSFSIPRAAVEAGKNSLTVRCTVPEGPTGNRPWFGIDSLTLQLQQ
ncbi:MAG: DUF4838 domain-containing protein [Armatimonadota bacterium]|nr:DUF4838 domain-containing protein [Armatimonadota bacterium]